MCGIFGMVALAERNLDRAMKAVATRGRDSWGYMDTNGVSIKELGNPNSFGGIQIQPRVAAVFNARAEPTTEWVKEKFESDIQPFQHGNWIVAHNGTIANDKDLKEEFEVPWNRQIDSWVIPFILATLPDDADLVDIHKLLTSKLKGSYAILIINKNRPDRLWAITNYKPLYYSTFDQGMMVASVPFALPGVPQRLEQYGSYEMTAFGVVNHVKRQHQKKKVLVVASGGLDSTVAATQAVRDGYDTTLLHFKYKCRAEDNEMVAIHDIASALGVQYRLCDLTVFNQMKSPLLQGNERIAGGEEGAEYAYEWVPARNLIMLSVAIGIAESDGYDTIYLGNNLEEAGAYPDNEPEFINRLNELLPYAVGDGVDVTIEMPVGNMMKHEIVKLGLELDAPMDLCWSCYHAGDVHCGQCGPCFMRRTAFEINGVPDTLEYMYPKECKDG